jgi:DNA-binding NarL/FixJ family response regulator
MKPRRILLVDDHDIVREGLRSLLTPQRHWQICGEAASGREAVEKALELRPDVVVMELALPEMDGLDATHRIREALPQTEVLILSVHDSEALVKEAFLAGAKAFVVKTDTRPHLMPALEALAQHQPFFSPAACVMMLKELLQSGTTGRSRKGLTQREREVVRLIADGKASKEIAAKLRISVRTVEAHRTNVMRKLNLRSVGNLVSYAVRNQIIPADVTGRVQEAKKS